MGSYLSLDAHLWMGRGDLCGGEILYGSILPWLSGLWDKGEDWKGPISCSSSSFEKGPRYLPLMYSERIISLKICANVSVDCLLGVYERCSCRMPA